MDVVMIYKYGKRFRYAPSFNQWNEFRIHKTSKFGLFVNEIKPIKFSFTIAKFVVI